MLQNTDSNQAVPLTEERGLQPARNPPPMPPVAPPAKKS